VYFGKDQNTGNNNCTAFVGSVECGGEGCWRDKYVLGVVASGNRGIVRFPTLLATSTTTRVHLPDGGWTPIVALMTKDKGVWQARRVATKSE
jgi:hypothetical protein